MPNANTKRAPWIGLTGGIGSGKSTALAMFRKKGAFILDADAIVHQLLAGHKSVIAGIRREFGDDVFKKHQTLDRKKLAAKAFSSTAQKRKLEHLIHPHVRNTIFKELKRNRGKMTVVDIPLLYESGWKNHFDAIIVVNAGLGRRVQRLRAKGFELSDIKRRIKSQWPLEKKIRLADFVVNNNGSRAQLKKQIDRLWQQLPHGGM